MESSSQTAESLPNRDRVLVIMAKAPRPGAVKTRLASSLSPEAVTAFYCCLLDDTLALARSLDGCGSCHHVPGHGCKRAGADWQAVK